MQKRPIVILSILWMVLLVAGVSSAVTMAICGAFSESPAATSGSTVEVNQQQYQMIERYERLEEVRTALQEDYYLELDESALVLGAVRGMMGAVNDPYTFYYTPEEMLQMKTRSSGMYEGVGLLVSSDKEGRVAVLRVFHDSPAFAAGVLPGDRVLKVNGVEVSAQTGKQLDEAIDRIKTGDGKLVTLTVEREAEILTLGMTRALLHVDRVDSEILDGGVGYIAIYEFVGDDVSGFTKAMNELKAAGVKKLILDVRSNPGGLLDDVVDILDPLMGEGMVVYTQDRYGRRSEYYSNADMWDVEMAVLVNGMSASASEILAGALQDSKRAIVVGETSFGKGIVQTIVPFREDDAGMQLTTATYFTPSGRSIHGVGITPDIKVELGEEEDQVYAGANLHKDTQLRAAYDALINKKR